MGAIAGGGAAGRGRGSRILRAAAAGAACGGSLALAELGARLLAGGGPRLGAWLRLGLLYAALLAAFCAGLAAVAALGRRADLPAFALIAGATLGLRVRSVLAGSSALTQALALAATVLCVALALWLPLRGGRWMPAAVLVWPLAACVFVALALLPPLAPAAHAAAFVIVALGLWTLAATALLRGTWPGRTRAALGLGAPLAAAVAAAMLLPAGGSFRDRAQTAAASQAGWLRGKPSVVLIVLDTVRARSVSSYGYARATTPRLDAFAGDAVRYPAAATPGTWTVPAHASLFTGLFPWQHGAGLPDVRSVLGSATPVLAEVLAQQGYATAGVAANPVLGPASGLFRGFRYYDGRAARRLLPTYPPVLYALKGHVPRSWTSPELMAWDAPAWPDAETITDRALGWLRRRPPGQPYLLFVNYMDAHTPFAPHAGFEDRWPGRVADWPWRGLPAEATRGAGLTAAEQAHLVAVYDDSLSYLDHELGRLLDGLRAQPGAEDTWIVVTADHGEMLGEHARLGHDCQLYEEVLRVPLVIRAPRGVRLPAPDPLHPLQLTDVAPLLVASLGLPPLPGTTPAGSRATTLAAGECACAAVHAPLHARDVATIVDGRFKYREDDGRGALFDLAADPQEAHDLAAQLPEEAARLRAALQQERTALVRRARPAEGTDEGPERRKALRALGYQ